MKYSFSLISIVISFYTLFSEVFGFSIFPRSSEMVVYTAFMIIGLLSAGFAIYRKENTALAFLALFISLILLYQYLAVLFLRYMLFGRIY